MFSSEDTIVAIASPTTAAARGVVRLSGVDTEAILVRTGIACPPHRRAVRYESQVDVGPPLGKIPISLLWWPTTRSYTGQPAAEIHAIGALPVLRALVDAAISAGARAANPGEFTMRAFLAGRLDLTQAEAVLGVIQAETTGSLDHALRQMAGNLASPLHQMRSEILDLLADVEAGLDFVDEDIQFISDAALVDRLLHIHQRLSLTSGEFRDREGVSGHPVVALCGPPNAGKSSLLNALAGSDMAIVSELAGTTRDVVSAQVNIHGRTLSMVDTAGIDTAGSEIDDQSQQQAARAMQHADIRLWCIDRSSTAYDATLCQLQSLAATRRSAGVIDLWVATKLDLTAERPTIDGDPANGNCIPCSVVTGVGIEMLRDQIAAAIASRDAEELGSVIGTAARCRQSLDLAQQSLLSAIDLTNQNIGHEFVSAELRRCAESLGEVTGAVYTDDILDRVFGRFCIGK
jgi:tRNA modification GTPase